MLIKSVASWLGILALVASSGAGAELELEITRELPPGLPDTVSARLGTEGFRVLQEGEVLGEFWLHTEPPFGGVETGELGISFGRLSHGALVGAAHFPNGWTDYRENDLEPGLYTLRYGVQPANGDHLGVSVYRDFLMLATVGADTEPDKVYDHEEELIELSQSASQKVHPAVLALFPIYEDVKPPQLLLNEVEQWTLVIQIGEEILGLVLLGHGEF